MRGRDRVPWVRALVLNVAMILALGGATLAAEFTADFVEKQGQATVTGRIWVKGDKIRREVQKGGEAGVVIMRLDQGVVWNIVPDQKRYMETPNVRRSDVDSPEMKKELEKMAERRELGKERVNGYECDKTQFMYRDKAMGTMAQWVSKKLGHPVKVEHRGPKGEIISFIEYRNIHEGAVSDSLFELPAGYEKTELPGKSKAKPLRPEQPRL